MEALILATPHFLMKRFLMVQNFLKKSAGLSFIVKQTTLFLVDTTAPLKQLNSAFSSIANFSWLWNLRIAEITESSDALIGYFWIMNFAKALVFNSFLCKSFCIAKSLFRICQTSWFMLVLFTIFTMMFLQFIKFVIFLLNLSQ